MTTAARRLVCTLFVALVGAAGVAAQQAAPPPAEDIGQEFRITAYPSYPITKNLTGFGYIGWVAKPSADYTATYLGTGTFYRAHPAVQLWLGLIGVYTKYSIDKSDGLELRPFGGIKFMGANARKWRYYDWTRYEIRFNETIDDGSWSTVHRVRNQLRLEVPLASLARSWTPKSFYLLSDVEPIYRSDNATIDPLRIRAGIGYIASQRLLVEFQYYAQYTHPSGAGLHYTDNIWRVNVKLITKKGVLSLLDGDIDD